MRAILLVALCLLPGCYSLACTRHDVVLAARESPNAVVLHVWVESGWLAEPSWGSAFLVPLFYPLDVLVSLSQSFGALDSPRYDIRWGPLGAILGITLPYVTLFPGGLSKIGPPYDTGLRVISADSLTTIRDAIREPVALERAMRAVPSLWHEKWTSAHFVSVRPRTKQEERSINEQATLERAR